MPQTVTELETQGLLLTPQERVHLANRLLSSLTEASDIDEAWLTEIEERLAELESGKVETISIEEAISRARLAIQ